jgi:ATP-dependent DNA ligase
VARNGHGFTEWFPAVAAAAFLLRKRSFLIDGEVVVCRADGTEQTQSTFAEKVACQQTCISYFALANAF